MKIIISLFLAALLVCFMYFSGLYSRKEMAAYLLAYLAIACLIALIALLRGKFSDKK